MPDLEYDKIARPDRPRMGGQPRLEGTGGTGSATPLIDQSWHQNLRSVRAGALDALPSLDLLTAPKFSDDPDFDPYAAAVKRGNFGMIDNLLATRSQDEFDWVSGRLESQFAKYGVDIARSPAAAAAGAMAGEVAYAAGSIMIPIMGPSAGLARALGRVATYTGLSAAEQGIASGFSSERTVGEAVNNFVLGFAVMSSMQGIITLAGARGRRLSAQAGKPMKTPAEMAEETVRAEAAVDGIKGEGSGRDPFAENGPSGKPGASVGAQGAGPMQTDAERIWANGMADALGAEHVPDLVAPLTRIIHSREIPEVTEVGELLLEVPYLLNKNRKGVRTEDSVEVNLRTRWRPVHADWRQTLDADYAEHLREIGEHHINQRIPGSSTLTDIKQRITNQTTHEDFRRLVWEDMARGIKDGPNWRPTEAVRRSAEKTREMYDKLIDEALDLELHIADLTARLARAADPTEAAAIKQEMIARTDGIKRNKSKFVNVIFDKEKIRANRAEFERYVAVKKRLTPDEASKAVDEVLQQRPFYDLNDNNRVGTPRSLHQRTLVDDPLEWREWLDDDVLNGGTLYMRTMSPDIELAKAFGTADMKAQLDDIRAGYQKKIDAAKSATEKQRLVKDRDGRIEDLMAVRDLLRGTYMIPPDPEHVISRSIRIAKNWNVATMLTGAIAAVPDTARLVTANGLVNSFGSLFEALRRPELYRMAKGEARSVGEAFEILLGTRAAIFSDIGEAVGAFSRVERVAAEIGQQSFNLNLMNFWNETMKSATSLVVSTKILSDIEALAAGRASQKAIERLASNGIDLEMARRIAAESGNWFRTDHNIIAQNSTWADAGASEAFRRALSRELNIVILTPGVAERPLWMSQTLDQTMGIEKGVAPSWMSQNYLSLIAQFKSFMMSSTYRTLIPALQQRDGDVVAMFAIATGMGMMIDRVRSEQGGYAPASNLFDAVLSGVDRAGILGWYMEPNNALERLSGRRAGLRPWFGDAVPYGPTGKTVAGTLGGPTGQQLANLYNVVSDIAGGDYDNWTARGLRKTLPMQNVAHFDWVFDQIEAGMRNAPKEINKAVRRSQAGPEQGQAAGAGALSIPIE